MAFIRWSVAVMDLLRVNGHDNAISLTSFQTTKIRHHLLKWTVKDTWSNSEKPNHCWQCSGQCIDVVQWVVSTCVRKPMASQRVSVVPQRNAHSEWMVGILRAPEPSSIGISWAQRIVMPAMRAQMLPFITTAMGPRDR